MTERIYPEIRTEADGTTYCTEHGGLRVKITRGPETGRRMAECQECGAYLVIGEVA